MKKKDNNRFVKTYAQGSLSCMEVWVDKTTGVNYLFHYDGYAGGMTVLLDAEGKAVVTKIEDSE